MDIKKKNARQLENFIRIFAVGFEEHLLKVSREIQTQHIHLRVPISPSEQLFPNFVYNKYTISFLTKLSPEMTHIVSRYSQVTFLITAHLERKK